MAAQVHAGDVGTVVLRTIRDENGAIVNLATATTLQLLFQRPDVTVVTKTAVMVGDGSAGQMQYVTVLNDPVFDVPGVWSVQGYIVLPSGSWHTDTVDVTVASNLV